MLWFFEIFSISLPVICFVGEKYTLKPYKNYHSTALSHYFFTDDTTALAFFFLPYPEEKFCSTKDIVILIQHSKYPLVFDNVSSNYWLQRQHLFSLKAPIMNEIHKISIIYPEPGVWFVSAFLPKEIEKIKQKGLLNCKYALNISYITDTNDYFEVIPNYNFTRPLQLGIINLKFKTPILIYVAQMYFTFPSDVNKSILLLNVPNNIICKLENNIDKCLLQINSPKLNEIYHININIHSISNVNATYGVYLLFEDCKNKENWTTQPLQGCNDTIFELRRFHLPRYFTYGFFIPHGPLPVNSFSLESDFGDGAVVLPFQLEDYIDNGLTLRVKIALNLEPSVDYDNIAHDRNKTISLVKVVNIPKYLYLLAGCLSYRQIPTLNVTLSLNKPRPNFKSDQTNGSLKIICGDTNNTFPIMAFADNGRTKTYRNIKNDNNIISKSSLQISMPQRNYSTILKLKNLFYNPKMLNSKINDIKAQYPMTGPYVLYLKPFCISLPEEEANIGGKEQMKLLKYDLCPERINYEPLVTFNVILEPCVSSSMIQKQADDVLNHMHEEIKEKKKFVYSSDEQKFPSEICGGIRRGRCQITGQQSLFITACQCLAGWDGIDCSNGTKAVSPSRQALNLFLLSLSNLAFLPAILFSIARNMYAEASIYTINMIFSTLYHACDEDIVKFCIAPYNILQYMDFYGAILSMIVTINVISALNVPIKSFLNLTASAIIALLVQINRLELWTFLGPLICMATIMLGSWIIQSYKSRSLYPPKNVLLKHIFPGMLMALVGLLIFCFGQNQENYAIMHSLWHILMAFAIFALITSQSGYRHCLALIPISFKPNTWRLLKIHIQNEDAIDDERVNVELAPG